jgi:methionyl-tRNA synthetase
MSKSLGNVIEPFALAEQFGADAVRYFLFREAPFGSDFSISVEKLRLRYNADLGNDLGNLLRRSLAMLAKYRNGLVPAASESALGERFSEIGIQVHDHVLALRFREALDTIWERITALNREIDDRKPWELYKHERGVELDALLYDLCEGLRFTAILLYPFMPSKATQMWRQLGLAGAPDVRWRDALQWGALAANTQTDPGDALFPRIEPALT